MIRSLCWVYCASIPRVRVIEFRYHSDERGKKAIWIEATTSETRKSICGTPRVHCTCNGDTLHRKSNNRITFVLNEFWDISWALQHLQQYNMLLIGSYCDWCVCECDFVLEYLYCQFPSSHILQLYRHLPTTYLHRVMAIESYHFFILLSSKQPAERTDRCA